MTGATGIQFIGNWLASTQYAVGSMVVVAPPPEGANATCMYIALQSTNSATSPYYDSDPRNSASTWYPMSTGCSHEFVVTSILVSGASPPWLPSANPGFTFLNMTTTNPVILNLATLVAGQPIYLQCTDGQINIGGGWPNTGCNGLTIDRPSINTQQPGSLAVNASTCFTGQVLASFATSLGVLIGSPICVQSTRISVTIPQGAYQLQFGINNTAIASDITFAPFTIVISQ